MEDAGWHVVNREGERSEGLTPDAVMSLYDAGSLARDAPVWHPALETWSTLDAVERFAALFEPRWYHAPVEDGGEPVGPHTADAIEALYESRELDERSPLWAPHLEAWQELGQLGVFAHLVAPRWFYTPPHSDTRRGPLSDEAISQHILAGELFAESLVWREGLEDWVRLDMLPAFAQPLYWQQRREPPRQQRVELARTRARSGGSRARVARARHGEPTLHTPRVGVPDPDAVSTPVISGGESELGVARPDVTVTPVISGSRGDITDSRPGRAAQKPGSKMPPEPEVARGLPSMLEAHVRLESPGERGALEAESGAVKLRWAPDVISVQWRGAAFEFPQGGLARIQLSRGERPLPQSWLERLTRRAERSTPALIAQLRGRRGLRLTLLADVQSTLLEGLTQHGDAHAFHITNEMMLTLIRVAQNHDVPVV